MADLSIERDLGGIVAGVDEVGRGALAGPVVATIVIIREAGELVGVKDSKLLSKSRRELLSKKIIQNAHFAVGCASAREVDELNILQATMLAMRRAIFSLNQRYDWLIVDGNTSPDPNNQRIIPVISGDRKSITIAAASIVAKVLRDGIMSKLHAQYPHYSWGKNAGYGTKAHIESIKQSGATAHHRASFLRRIYSCE